MMANVLSTDTALQSQFSQAIRIYLIDSNGKRPGSDYKRLKVTTLIDCRGIYMKTGQKNHLSLNETGLI